MLDHLPGKPPILDQMQVESAHLDLLFDGFCYIETCFEAQLTVYFRSKNLPVNFERRNNGWTRFEWRGNDDQREDLLPA